MAAAAISIDPASGLDVGGLSTAEQVALMPLEEQNAFWAGMSADAKAVALWDWNFWARAKQKPPPGDWWIWNLRAGRGFGKTRTGGGWVHYHRAMRERREIALVAKTPADARDYMIEGPGGLLKNTPPWERPKYEPSKRRLTWPNGSVALIFSSEEPGQLRGFSGDTAWVDEFAKYDNPREVWDNLLFGMREASSDQPRIVITSTPRPIPILEEIEAEPACVTVVGSSYENRANLAAKYYDRSILKYEGTRLGEQEIHATILGDLEGRVYRNFSRQPFPEGNVSEMAEDHGSGELLVGQDFNVDPMATVLAVRAGWQCHVFDAWTMDNANTDVVMARIKVEYPNRYVAVYPDPSGKSRHTNAPVGQTDYTIIERYGFEIRAPSKAPPVVDRVNNSNALYSRVQEDGTVLRSVLIHPRAEPLIRALNGLTYKKGTSQRDKNSGFDHPCDALDYLLWEEFNVLQDLGAEFINYLI